MTDLTTFKFEVLVYRLIRGWPRNGSSDKHKFIRSFATTCLGYKYDIVARQLRRNVNCDLTSDYFCIVRRWNSAYSTVRGMKTREV